MEKIDIVVIGAGAAGLFCAGVAGRRGARVVLIDHAARLAEKIRISGGGRCNFTNLAGDDPKRFVGEDTRFARHALRAYPPARFIELVRGAGIDYHEKHRGQLFCDQGSEAIIDLLRAECAAGGVSIRHPVALRGLRAAAAGTGFEVQTDHGTLAATQVVLACGGLSIPKIGATDLGYRLARQFGLRVVEPRPGLVPLTFEARGWQPFAALAGVAAEVVIGIEQDPARARFEEDLLFTHRGLSGPAVLQISSHWRPGEALCIDLANGHDLAGSLRAARDSSRQQVDTVLSEHLPRRLAAGWLASSNHADIATRRIAELGNRRLDALAADLRRWCIVPTGSEGYRKAEVTVGGIATEELDPRTLQARKVPGLYCIGEVVDVTGWLGGYNFQWAWSSAFCAAMAMTAPRH